MVKARRKTEPEGLLSHSEVDRLSDWLANEFEGESTRVARFLLLVDHLESLIGDPVMFNVSVQTIKQRLFAMTTEASTAQQKFEAQAHQERGKLLRWPRGA